MINWKDFKKFLLVSKFIKIEWSCSLGCPHTYDRPIYRWYVRLYKWIKEKFRRNKFTLPRFSKNVPPFPPLINSDNINIIPMTEPTGIYFAMKYLYTGESDIKNKDKDGR